MKANLIAFTKFNSGEEKFNLRNALEFCAKMGGICYMKDDFNTLLNESKEVTDRRLNQVLTSGHHSVFDHFKLTFEISQIPKILAMILNNEKDYSTSEKSARYTKFENLPEKEGMLYSKWIDKLSPIILEKYPILYKKGAKNPMLRITKLAQENARYFVSIFTPLTTMGYTVSLRQLNYLLYMMEEYIATCESNSFNLKLVPYLKEFVSLFDEYRVKDLIPKGKNRKLSLFGDKRYENIPDTFSYVYQTSFKASYACMAQSQRHRSEHSFIYNLDKFEFYIPEIIQDNETLKEEWLRDAKGVADLYPQGRLIKIVQTGNLDTLLLKARERVCGQAQLEIMRHTVSIINKFKENSEYGYIIEEETNNKTAKCKFSNADCFSPCIFGAKQFERKI